MVDIIGVLMQMNMQIPLVQNYLILLNMDDNNYNNCNL